ncbi:hypothetical protein RRG08_019501 [Elysia crispata]|uniref:Uncharacterized protein n=1 Tax=Elysia crispata TaxID=231223 RepID=A0AAE0YI93_9GAST|nr:hypothetical protein RRG08_019501 [Elysia crispata]
MSTTLGPRKGRKRGRGDGEKIRSQPSGIIPTPIRSQPSGIFPTPNNRDAVPPMISSSYCPLPLTSPGLKQCLPGLGVHTPSLLQR